MSFPTSDKLHGGSAEEVVSRADFELVQRFLRVARLLQPQSINIDPTLTQQSSHQGASVLSTVYTTALGHVEHDYGNNDKHTVCDEDEDEDEDDDYEYGKEISRPKRRNTRGSQQEKVRAQQTTTRTPISRQRQQQGNSQQYRETQPQRQRPHAAVEKRYRSVLNSKIQQLSNSIPPSNTFNPAEPIHTPNLDGWTKEESKVPAKSVVLDRAVQYIEHLVSTYEQYETEQDTLRAKLQLWLDNTPFSTGTSDVTHQ